MESTYIIDGIGVSNGRAIGRIQTLESNMDHEQPCILIVEELSRSVVTALPENVVGVISMNGSVGSHGSGILRELKIPCVLRIKDIFRTFEVDEVVEIVGDSGKVIKLGKSMQKSMQYVNPQKEIKLQSEKCYRPNRIYQTLRFSIMKDAWEYSPAFLFGLPKCELHLRKGVVYIDNGPDLDDICSMVIENPDWYISMAKKRSIEIQEIKNGLKKIEASYTNNTEIVSVIAYFKTCVRLYQKLIKYIFFTQFISDSLTEKLLNFIEQEDKSKKEEFINSLKSNYVKNALKSKADPGVSTYWRFPSAKPHIWEGTINWERNLGDCVLLNRIWKNSEQFGISYFMEYSALQAIVPIVYQMSEEHYFVSSSLSFFMNHFLEKIAETLVAEKELYEKDEIYDLEISELYKRMERIKERSEE